MCKDARGNTRLRILNPARKIFLTRHYIRNTKYVLLATHILKIKHTAACKQDGRGSQNLSGVEKKWIQW